LVGDWFFGGGRGDGHFAALILQRAATSTAQNRLKNTHNILTN
jgi:hypothetical protein